MSDNKQRLNLLISGTVQGVGFRPAIYNYATKLGLKGFVKNTGGQVSISLEGPLSQLDHFLKNFINNLPREAYVEQVKKRWASPQGYSCFQVKQSGQKNQKNISIPPDLVTCKKCFKEFYNPKDPRYLYPFIACTHCGPRYSLTEKLPYDRANTTMREFPFCELCKNDYNSPLSRRFHAQNFACPTCGPQLSFYTSKKEKIFISHPVDQLSWIYEKLKSDHILAFKGIGGYQLICNAQSKLAINKLRQRKNRPHQALAVMAKDISLLKENKKTINLLTDPSGPIVILNHHYNLPLSEISPDTLNLGIFLPTSALHNYLFGAGQINNPLSFLIVTSGNSHGEPMALSEEQAFDQLSEVADFFVTHNRKIHRSVDDSIIKPSSPPQIWRRSRGFAPKAITLNQNYSPTLAMGADLKNTFCVLDKNKAYVSPHMGDLLQLNSYEAYKKNLNEFLEFSQIKPQSVVIDLHPNYLSTQFGLNWAKENKIPIQPVQHHLAHGVSVMAEHELTQSLALVFDGTGFGEDQDLWGGECFYIHLKNKFYERHLSLELMSLLGGEKAILEPKRLLYERLKCIDKVKNIHPQYEKLYEKKVLFPKTSSMGRLFDAVSVWLQPKYQVITYEAQAPMALEALAKKALFEGKVKICYDIFWQNNRILTAPLFLQIEKDLALGVSISQIALNFHETVAQMGADMAQSAYQKFNCKNICLTGGVFQNEILSGFIKQKLSQMGFNIFEPELLPPGDGGISFGQAIFGSLLEQNERKIYART